MSQPCLRCGTIYPHDAEHFFLCKRDGLSNICRDCHKATRKKAAEAQKAKRRAALKKIESSAVDLYAKLAVAGGSNIPHSAELVEKVCEYFGGVAGFAAIMVKQYWDSKPGSSTRNKLLETVTRLIQNNVDNGGAKKPLTLWTEEELEAELQDRFRTAVLSQRRILDAQATPAIESSAEDPAHPDDDAASGGQDQGTPGGTEGAADGGVAALPAQPGAGEGASVPIQ